MTELAQSNLTSNPASPATNPRPSPTAPWTAPASPCNPTLAQRQVDAKLISDRAWSLLRSWLVDRYKLGLTADHEAVLQAMLREFALMTTGAKKGRVAFPLGAGCGKSQSILATVVALHQLQNEHSLTQPYPVMVCSSRAETLCEMVADLVDPEIGDVPEGAWSLLHSVSTASRQRSKNAHAAPYLFTTHARAKKDRSSTRTYARSWTEQEHSIRALATWTDPQSQCTHSRMIFWDEGLMVSDSWAIPRRTLFSTIKGLDELLWGLRDSEGRMTAQKEAVDFLQACLPALKQELEEQIALKRSPLPVYLPDRSEAEIEMYKNALRTVPGVHESVFELLDIAHAEIRAVATSGYEDGSYISFHIAVPDFLETIAVLDASYTARLLCLADETVSLVDDPVVTDTVVKRYNEKNELRIIKHGGGRRGVERSARGDRSMFVEIARIIKDEIPDDEDVLIGTFKDRPRSNRYHVAIQETILRTLRDEGVVNVDARVKFITYGQETATNKHRNIKNCILAGVMQRAEGDLISAFIGQTFTWNQNLTSAQVEALKVSEATHVAYQLMHRTTMRKMDGGFALPSRTWIFYQNPAALWQGLMPLMPGLTPQRHINHVLPKLEDKMKNLSAVLVDYLQSIPADVVSIRCSELKQAVCAQSNRMTFIRALNTALTSVEWERCGAGWKSSIKRKDHAPLPQA